MMNVNVCNGDRRQAQDGLRSLMDLAVRYLGTAELEALSFTIAAYLDGRAVPSLISDQFASEHLRPLLLDRVH